MGNIGSIEFWLRDDRDSEYNESVDCTWQLYGDEEDEILSIENYHYYCKRFALAMGFAEDTVNEWFGKY
jgi:hypothetical protein